MAKSTLHLVLALLYLSHLTFHFLQRLPNARLQLIELLLTPGLDHHCFPVDLSLEFSASYGHSLVYILVVGSFYLRHSVIHRLNLATSSEILKLLPKYLMFWKVL